MSPQTTSCTGNTMPKDLLVLLETRYARYWWKPADDQTYQEAMKDPFTTIIHTVLSQNTSSENTRRAFKGLTSQFTLTPECLAAADGKKISAAIRPGGLHRIKARRIKEISAYILQKYQGDLSWVFTMPKDHVRHKIMMLPGIGDKTADVLLASIHGQREALVIDTHMARITRRLGLVPRNASYDEIQEKLHCFFPWEHISRDQEERVVGLFWLLAKHTCTARKPHCNACILEALCAKAI